MIVKEIIQDMKDMFNQAKPYMKMILVLLLFMASSYISILIANILDIDPRELLAKDEATLIVISLFLILLAVIFIYRKELKYSWFKFKKTAEADLKLAFTYWFVGVLFMMASNFLLSKAGMGIPNNESSVRAMLDSVPFIAGIQLIFIGPILEELVFRQSFYSAFKNKKVFVIVSTLLFGSIHVFGAMTSYYDLLYLIPYSSVALAFGLTMYKTETVYPTIITHIWHNFLTFFVTFLFSGVIV